MKKNYSKPDIMFESFQLSANIAASCSWMINGLDLHDRETCSNQFSDGQELFANSGICVKVVSPDTDRDGVVDQYCYHVPYSTYMIFNSD